MKGEKIWFQRLILERLDPGGVEKNWTPLRSELVDGFSGSGIRKRRKAGRNRVVVVMYGSRSNGNSGCITNVDSNDGSSSWDVVECNMQIF